MFKSKYLGYIFIWIWFLLQQLGTDVYGYETMHDCQVNEYVASDNTKPFGEAPNSQRALVQWKPVWNPFYFFLLCYISSSVIYNYVVLRTYVSKLSSILYYKYNV